MATYPRVLSIASGIGGLDVGVKLALPSARTVCYVENEASACAVLVERMQERNLDDAPLWTDARTFDGIPWRRVVDMVIAGYPCQPFTTMGKNKQFDDPRDLWKDVYRIIRETDPTFVFLENVAVHVRRGFVNRVLPDLRRAGYNYSRAVILSAESVGSPHLRKRLFSLSAKMDDASDDARWANVQQFFARSGRALVSEHTSTNDWLPRPDDVDGWQHVVERTGDSYFPWWRESRLYRESARLPERMDVSRTDRIRFLGNTVVPQQAALALYILMRDVLNADSDHPMYKSALA